MAGMLEYKCPCCDGAIQFDSATQKMKCPYCDTEFDVDTLKGYDEELRAFFKYLCGKEPSSGFTDRLSALVERVKTNAQWRHRFMTWEQEMAIQSNEKAKELAKELAQEIAQDMTNQKVIETAQKMLKEKIGTPEQISIVTSIPLEKILELKKKLQ